jgi:acetyltransferase-like isoleucine patch superfamily enzyme
MELITDFSYFNGIKSINTGSSLQQSDGLNAGINSFDFPLDVKDYGEEPFLVGGKYGLYFVASGDVSENMVDFRVDSGSSISGGIVFTGNGLTLSVTYTKMNDLSCARINQMAWNAAVTKWGANAKTNFGKLTKMYFNGFEGNFILKPYYRGTDDIITELNAKLSNNYVYCTSITSGIQFGGSIYMKKPIIINGNKVSMGIGQQSFTVTNNTNDLDINIKFVPRFKTAIQRLINPTDCRIQELFGLNSIYGIMDRLTFKHTKHITHYGNSTATINVFFIGEYLIDTKVIQTLGSSEDLPAMDNSFVELYCNNTIRVNESSTTQLEVRGSNLDYVNDQILIHLYDEDNVILPSVSDYTNVDFIPPTCVFDFPMDEDDTAATINFSDGISLGRKTNGLITNLFIDCDNTLNEGALQMHQRYSIYFTKLKYWVEQNSNDQAEYYNLCVINYATPMLRTLSTSSIVNEAIGVCSDNFIVIDGIPRGCNDTHYLTGTIFVKESTATRTMHVYIGVRSLNNHVLNKITHYLDYSFSDYKRRGSMPYYSEGGYSDYGKILMTSDYTVFLSYGQKKTPVLTDYKTARKYNDDSSMLNSLKSISNQINSLEENMRIDMARGCMPSELWGNTMLPYISDFILDTQTAITANDYEAIRENFSVIEVDVYSVGNVLQGTYKDTEYNIRFMTYPTFSDETSTSVNNVSGMFIENKIRRTVIGYKLQLTDFYSNFQNCVSKGLDYTRTFTNVWYQEYYYNGIAISQRMGAASKVILKNVLYDIPLTNHNLIAPHDAFLFKPQTSDKYLATNDTALLKKNVQLHPMCKILTDSKGSEIGTIKVSSIMKMDFNYMQYYVDMSVRIQIMPSMYRNVWYFPENLFELFKITIGMGSTITSDVTYYPLDPDYHRNFLRENHPQVTYHVDNGILITNFRVLETSTCPFNFSNLMKITVNFSLKTNFYSSSPYRTFSYTFNLMDTITPKIDTLQYCGSLFVPSYSIYDRVNTGVTATFFNGATNTYANNPFNNNNAGVVIKTKSGTGKTHILLRSSAESRKSVQYGTNSRLVMTTIYTVNDISSVLKMYPIIISRGVATGTIPTSYVYRLAYQNHKPVAANKPIIARVIISNTTVKYYILNHDFGLIYSGSTNASMSNYYSYTTSSLYLGGDISVINSNANYQICIKYASIDNFEELRCNNIDF